MSNNAEFFQNAKSLKAANLAFNEIFRDSSDAGIRAAVEDPYVFVTRSADTALQPELKVGSIVQVKTNLHGEGLSLKYAVVSGHEWLGGGSVTGVKLRFADGSYYTFRVKKRVFHALTSGDKMETNDIKSAEIPEDLVKLAGCVNLDRCPLKKEGACLDE